MGKCWYEVAEVIKVRLVKYYNLSEAKKLWPMAGRGFFVSEVSVETIFFLFP